jgi:hypothetical protein
LWVRASPDAARFPFAANAGSFRRTITAIRSRAGCRAASAAAGGVAPREDQGGGEAGAGPDVAKAPRQKLTATPETIEQRMAALERVRKQNPYRDIADPVASQREMREDVKLPGR